MRGDFGLVYIFYRSGGGVVTEQEGFGSAAGLGGPAIPLLCFGWGTAQNKLCLWVTFQSNPERLRPRARQVQFNDGLNIEDIEGLKFSAEDDSAVEAEPAAQDGGVESPEVGVDLQCAVIEVGKAWLFARHAAF